LLHIKKASADEGEKAQEIKNKQEEILNEKNIYDELVNPL
jgi:hypothetical protein